MAITNAALIWLFSFGLIWFLFIRRDDKGENYAILGSILFVINGFIGFWVTDDVTTWLIFTISLIYFLKIMSQHKLFQIGGGF